MLILLYVILVLLSVVEFELAGLIAVIIVDLLLTVTRKDRE